MLAAADTRAASLATAINAGSAIVVEKPNKKENDNNQKILPFLANAWERDSPIGNSPISRPSIKSIRPKTTNKLPTKTSPKFGNGCLITTNWKKLTTNIMGTKSRQALLNLPSTLASNFKRILYTSTKTGFWQK